MEYLVDWKKANPILFCSFQPEWGRTNMVKVFRPTNRTSSSVKCLYLYRLRLCTQLLDELAARLIEQLVIFCGE